jgi:Ca2+-binding EF-hand superfamily protein
MREPTVSRGSNRDRPPVQQERPMHPIARSTVLTAALALAFAVTPALVRGEANSPDRRRGPRAQRPEHRHRPHVRDVLRKFDADGDGKLSESERQAAKAHRQQQVEQRRERWRDRLDTDGDREVSESEKQTALDRLKQHHPQRYQKLVERADADGDGEVSPDEARAAREAHRRKMKQRRARLIERFDANDDGELSANELNAARQAHRRKMRRRIIERFDTNDDGRLSQAEKATAFDRMMQGRLGGGRSPRRHDRRAEDPPDADGG